MFKNLSNLISGFRALLGVSPSVTAAQDRYFIAAAQEDGMPLIVRGLRSVPPDIQESSLPIRGVIVWRYGAGRNGMPDADISEAQTRFEDAIISIERHGEALQALIFTGGDRKEWHWYVSDFDSWRREIIQIGNSLGEIQLEITSFHDPGWEFYRELMAMAGN